VIDAMAAAGSIPRGARQADVPSPHAFVRIRHINENGPMR